MAMGFKPNARGIFGNPQWLPGVEPEAIQHSMPQTAQPAKQGGGFFGEGGAGRGIAGSIGDYLLQASGMRPIYAPQMQQNRAMEFAQKHAERQRQQGWEDYTRKYQYELANPKPTAENPTSLQQNYDWLIGQGRKAEAENLLKRQTDPIQWITGPDGIPRPVSMGSAIPSAPVGKLTPIGGAGSNASGGFPGR